MTLYTTMYPCPGLSKSLTLYITVCPCPGLSNSLTLYITVCPCPGLSKSLTLYIYFFYKDLQPTRAFIFLLVTDTDIYTDRGDACRLGTGQVPSLFSWLVQLQVFLSLPPSPPVFDTFLHAVNLFPLTDMFDNHTGIMPASVRTIVSMPVHPRQESAPLALAKHHCH